MIIKIEPKPQSRPKFSKWGTYEAPEMKAWRRRCALLIKRAWKGERLEWPLKVDVTFYLPAPQAISKKPTPRAKLSTKARYQDYLEEKIPHSKRPDLDNYLKSLFDSIGDAGNVWQDDSQVCCISAKKLYSPKPRIEVEITEL